MDSYAMHGGEMCPSTGTYLALAHYIGYIPTDDFVIIHKELTPHASFPIFVLRCLSKQLCVALIGQSVSFIILVKKSLVMTTFGIGYQRKVLAHIGIAESIGLDSPCEIANAILTGQLPIAKKRRTSLVKRIPKSHL